MFTKTQSGELGVIHLTSILQMVCAAFNFIHITQALPGIAILLGGAWVVKVQVVLACLLKSFVNTLGVKPWLRLDIAKITKRIVALMIDIEHHQLIEVMAVSGEKKEMLFSRKILFVLNA